MTSRRLLLLAVLAVLAIAGALLLSRQPATTASKDTQLLYPELKSELNAVNSIEIFKAADTQVVAVKRKGDDWTVTSRSDFPADAAKIRKFLIATSEAQLVEEKTSNPANYPAIGVEDVTASTATGHRVAIGGTAKPLNLIIGKQATGSRAQYVRRAGDKQSWLIGDSLDLPTALNTWLRKDIIDVAADRVQSVTVEVAGTKPYTAAKTSREQMNFSIDGLPKGKELSSPSPANSAGSALIALTLADVRKVQDVQAAKPAAHATFNTFDGLVVQIDGWVQDGKHYVALTTANDPAQAERFKAAPADKPADATAKTAAGAVTPKSAERDVAAESTRWNSQLAGWAYEIPDYKYEAIFRPLDKLLKK